MNSVNTFFWGTRSVSLNFRCLLSDAERAKRYSEKNRNVVRESDNLYEKHKCLSMKLNDPLKNTQRFKKQRLAKVCQRTLRSNH